MVDRHAGLDRSRGLRSLGGLQAPTLTRYGHFELTLSIATFSPCGGAASIIVVRHSQVAPTIARRRRSLVLELKPPDPLRRPG